MWEYEILRNEPTGGEDDYRIIQGYSFEDSCRRYNLNPKDWKVLTCEYVD